MRRTIGGTLTLQALARLHAPRTSEEVQAEVHRLASQGYSDHSISHAMGLAVEQVRRILAVRA